MQRHAAVAAGGAAHRMQRLRRKQSKSGTSKSEAAMVLARMCSKEGTAVKTATHDLVRDVSGLARQQLRRAAAVQRRARRERGDDSGNVQRMRRGGARTAQLRVCLGGGHCEVSLVHRAGQAGHPAAQRASATAAAAAKASKRGGRMPVRGAVVVHAAHLAWCPADHLLAGGSACVSVSVSSRVAAPRGDKWRARGQKRAISSNTPCSAATRLRW